MEGTFNNQIEATGNSLCRFSSRAGCPCASFTALNEERLKNDRYFFRKEGIIEKINLQRDSSKAKAYQVRQVRNVILKYNLGGKL